MEKLYAYKVLAVTLSRLLGASVERAWSKREQRSSRCRGSAPPKDGAGLRTDADDNVSVRILCCSGFRVLKMKVDG